MKKFTTFLFVALMALLSIPLNAATITYDFQAERAKLDADVTVTSSGTSAGKNGMGTALEYPKELSNVFNGNFGFFFRSECTVKLTSEGLVMSGSKDTYISILNLKKDDKVTVTYTGSILFCDKPVANIEGVTDQWTACESDKEYTLTADGNFNVQWKKSKTVISKIVVETSATETVSAPGIAVTGVNGINRTVTITPGSGSFGSAVSTYYTTDGTDPTAESTAYTEPFTVSADTTTVKAISILGDGTASEISTLKVAAGTEIKLEVNATLTDVTEAGNEYKFNVTNTNLIGNPVFTYNYSFNGENGTGETYTANGKGTLTVTVSAEGYATSDPLEVNVISYIPGETLILNTADVLAEDNAEWTYNTEGTRFANWSGYNGVSKQQYPYWTPATDGKGKIGNFTFEPYAKGNNNNQEDIVLMRTVGFIHNSGTAPLKVIGLDANVTVKFVVSVYGKNPFNVFVNAVDGVATYDLGAGNAGYAVEAIQIYTIPFEPVDVTASVDVNAWKSDMGNVGNYTKDVAQKEQYLTNTTTNGKVLYQTVEGLGNGTYTVELYANASYTFGRGFASAAADGDLARAIVYAGNVEKTIPVIHQTGVGTNNIVKLENVIVSDGKLEMGLRKDIEGSNWHTIQIKSLVYESNKEIANEEAQVTYWTGVRDNILANENYKNVAGVEKAALTAAATIADIKAAIPAFYAAKSAYDNLVAAIELAKADNVDCAAAEAILANAETNAAAATEALHVVKLAVNTSKATEGADMTFTIVNPSFENGTTGWTYEPSNDHGAKENSNGTYTMSGCDGNFIFNIWSSGNAISQTIEDLPNGTYKLQATIATDGGQKVQLNANDKSIQIDAIDKGTGVEGELEFQVFDNKATIGAEGVNKYWYKVDNFRLTFVKGINLDELIASYDEALAAANAVEGKMNAEISAALATAIKTYGEVDKTNSDALTEAVAALTEATATAKASVAAYAHAAEVLPKMEELTKTTNVYTAEALDEYYNQWVVKYDNATMTNAEATMLQNPFLVTGWRANTTVDNFLLSAWDTNPDFQDAPYYINSWSTEGENDGSEFKVPFFEYWTGDGDSLGEKTLTATMNGLEPGDYKVSALVRPRIKNGAEGDAYGITFQINDGEAVSATAGEQVGESQFRLDEITAEGTVGEDGILAIKFIVAADNNISWLAFKNVKYQKVEVEEPVVYKKVNVKSDMFYKWDGFGADANKLEKVNVDFNVGNGTELGAGSMVAGTSTVDYLIYADLTGSKTLFFEGTPGVQLRVLMNRQESNNGPLVEKNPVIGEDGTAELDLSEMEYVHINAIKTGWGSPAGTISSLKVLKPMTPLELAKDSLSNTIAEAEGINADTLSIKTDASVEALNAAVAAGKAELEKEDATIASLEAAIAAIESAINGLVTDEAKAAHFAAKKDLEGMITKAEAADLSKKTPESAEALTAAIAHAKEVLANPASTTEELIAEKATLKAAYEALEDLVIYKQFTENTVFIPTAEAVAAAKEEGWFFGGETRTDNKKFSIDPETDEAVAAATAPGLGLKKGNKAKSVTVYVTGLEALYAYGSSTGSEERTLLVTATPKDGGEAISEKVTTDGTSAIVKLLGLDKTKNYKIEFIGTNESDEAKDVVLHAIKFVADYQVLLGINSINADKESLDIYNLQGQKVQSLKKGLYIINGKKVVRK